MVDLSQQHVLITGAGSGVGASIAQTFGAQGARLTLVGRRAEPLREVAAQLDDAISVVADVRDEEQVDRACDAAREAYGAIDILIANAGAAESAPLAKTTLEIWQAMLDVNLTGVFLCARAVMPDMLQRGQGRIVAIASTAGLKGYPYVSAYCAAKHGVIGLVRALATEAADCGVTVNAICPGFTDTPLLQRSIEKICSETGRSAEQVRTALMRSNPQGRFITPREVADTALWLVSPGAMSVTGQALSVSGGEV